MQSEFKAFVIEAITQTVTVLLFSSAFHLLFHSMESVIDHNVQFLSESVGF